MFTDGPWCGGGTTRFDADLLRIRLVRVTLRVQATAATMRAAARMLRRRASAASRLAISPIWSRRSWSLRETS